MLDIRAVLFGGVYDFFLNVSLSRSRARATVLMWTAAPRRCEVGPE